MDQQAASVPFPADLLQEIDALVGEPGRGAFLRNAARAELNRLQLLEILRRGEPIWTAENHPELAQGASEWVRGLRDESEKRLERLYGSTH